MFQCKCFSVNGEGVHISVCKVRTYFTYTERESYDSLNSLLPAIQAAVVAANLFLEVGKEPARVLQLRLVGNEEPKAGLHILHK